MIKEEYSNYVLILTKGTGCGPINDEAPGVEVRHHTAFTLLDDETVYGALGSKPYVEKFLSFSHVRVMMARLGWKSFKEPKNVKRINDLLKNFRDMSGSDIKECLADIAQSEH